MDKLLTPKEAVELFKLSPVTIKKWLWQGKLKGVKVGSLWRIRERDLAAFLKSDDHEDREKEAMSSEDWAAIKRGLEDVKSGRYVTLEEYEQGKRP